MSIKIGTHIAIDNDAAWREAHSSTDSHANIMGAIGNWAGMGDQDIAAAANGSVWFKCRIRLKLILPGKSRRMFLQRISF